MNESWHIGTLKIFINQTKYTRQQIIKTK